MHKVDVGVLVCTILFIASTIDCDDNVDQKCTTIPKHYEELGCEEIKDKNNETGCVTRFECPDFANADSSVCHLNGKQYNVSDTVDAEDAPNFLFACKCIDDGHSVAFTCASGECPEDLGTHHCTDDCDPAHDSASCISVYENLTSLCRSNEICDENEIGKLPKCFFGDNVYRLGEKFDPVSHSCHECLCTADFDNVTAVPDNVNCRRINCGIAILEARHIRDGCVPIYYGHDRCCPIDSRCPSSSNDDELMETDLKSAFGAPIDGTACTFGNVTLQIDQQLKTGDKCLECKCTIPPMVTCTQLPGCRN